MFDLVKTAAPPREPEEAPSPADWPAVEARIGFELPGDYRELVQLYGSGIFDAFLWVLNPFATNDNFNLLDQAPIRLDAQRDFEESTDEPNPYPLHPDPCGLYPWAVTANGDVLYWLKRDGVPSRRIVGCDAHSTEWWEGDYSTAEFLSLLLSGRLRMNIFPDDFPSDSPSFVRLSDVRCEGETID